MILLERALRALEADGEIFWTTSYWGKEDDSLEIGVNCNDFFVWACGDVEMITENNIEALEQARRDLEEIDEAHITGLLFCARERQSRPQGAFYCYLPEEAWHLFDACGPFRKTGPGNPVPHPSEPEWAKNDYVKRKFNR